MRASIGPRIEGRPVDESASGQNGGGLGGPVAVVARVLPIGYLPHPGKVKGKISKIRYPGGFEYLRVVVSMQTLWALAGSSLRSLKFLLLIMDPLPVSKSGVLISSHLMWCLFLRWSTSLR